MGKTFRQIAPIFLIITFLFSGISFAQKPIRGKVIAIADGDTITVLQNNRQYKIRLYGIDTPEKKQAFGQKAKKFTSDIAMNQQVKVVTFDIDRYGRIVGMVYIGQECLNEALIKNGFAWAYRKYCKESFCNKWLEYEQAARANRIGLWSSDNPMPPWEFRRN